MNTSGNKISLTTFGESHGVAVGGVIDGFPAGVSLDFDMVDSALRRRSGRDLATASQRAKAEQDEVQWLSGIMDGVSLGSPIAFMVANTAHRSADYEALRDVYRPGHADEAYMLKYGIRDHRGGGRASARTTLPYVVAAALVQQLPMMRDISIDAYLVEVGGREFSDNGKLVDFLRGVQAEGDSVGGIVECVIRGLPAGVGEPLDDKLQARLAQAMMSIPAAKGFEYGTGFEAARMRGSICNKQRDGIAGGISTGDDITMRVAFKPTPSIIIPQKAKKRMPDGSVSEVDLSVGGRHDVCAALRAPVIVEAMATLVIANLI